MSNYTQMQQQAASDALLIIEGAVNPKGIALALREAYLAEQDTDAAASSPAALLIISQLLECARRAGARVTSDIFEDIDGFGKAMDACKERIK